MSGVSKGTERILCFFRKSTEALLFVPMLCTVLVTNEVLINEPASAKYFWFYGSMGLVALTVMGLCGGQGKSFRWRWGDGMVLLFGGVALGASYLATGQADTKWILLLLCVVLYFYFRWVLTNRANRYVLMLSLLVTALLEEVWGLLQLYGVCPSQHNLFLTTGSFFNPGPYAGYLAVTTPIALYYVCTDFRVFSCPFHVRLSGFYVRWVVSAGVLLGALLVLPPAMSRAAWVAVSAGCLMVVWQLFRRSPAWKSCVSRHRKRVAAWGGVLLIGLSLGCAGLYHLKKDSADGRLLIWKVAMGVLPEHPWGVGLNRFSGTYGEAQAAYFAAGLGSEQEKYVAGAPEYAFNEYVQLCMELGFVPFLLFIGWAIYMLRACSGSSTSRGSGRSAVSGAWVSLLVFATMSYPFSVLPFVILLVFLAAYAMPMEPVRRQWLATCGAATALLAVAFCLYNRYPTYAAYKRWEEVKPLYSLGYYEGLGEEYEKLHPYLCDKVQFLFEYGQVLCKTGQYERSNAVLSEACRISCDPMLYNVMGRNYQALKQYGQAEAAFTQSANIVPNRHYPHYLLAKLYMEQGDTLKAKAKAQYVIAKEPKVPSRAIEEMKEEMKAILEVADSLH